MTSVRVPSGRLVVDSPWPKGRRCLELAERIPFGTYRVEAAYAIAPYEFMGEHDDGRHCAAIRLQVRDQPVSVWERALRASDDNERLRPELTAGFETDTGMGCFADGAAWPALTEPFRRFWEEAGRHPGVPLERDTLRLHTGEFEKVTDERLEADLVTFPAEDGLTTVWLGRTTAGEIAALAVAAPSPL